MKLSCLCSAAVSLFGCVASGQQLRSEAKLNTPVPIRQAITCEKGALIVGSGEDGAVYAWTLPNTSPVKMDNAGSSVRRMACAGGNSFAAGFRDGKVVVVDVASGVVRQRFEAKYAVQAISFSPEGSLVAIATNGMPTQLWGVRTGQRLAVGVTNLGASWSTAFSPKGDVFVSADEDTYIRAYDRQGKLLYSADGGLLESFAITFTADGGQFAVAGAGGTISLFDTASGKKLKSSNSGGNPVWTLTMFPDSQQIVALEVDDFRLAPAEIALWDMRAEMAKPTGINPKDVIGTGTNEGHALLLRQDGPEALSVFSLQ